MLSSKTNWFVNNLRALPRMETSMIISRMQHIGPRGTEPLDHNVAEKLRQGQKVADETHGHDTYEGRPMDRDSKSPSAHSLKERASEMAHDVQEKLGEVAQSAKQKLRDVGKKIKGEK